MNYMKSGNWVRYQNGNYFVSINLDNGTKIRETINPDATEFIADFPESADVKITNRCTNPLGYTNLTDEEIKCGKGNCNFCHEGSGPCGKHSDALHSHVWNTFHPYTEIACLSGNTVVHTEFGSKDIKELQVGDKIYDENYQLRKVVKITTSNKDCIHIKGKKGFDVVCSKDHPFIDYENNLVMGENLLNKKIKKIPMTKDLAKTYCIDLSEYMHHSNPNLENSRGGKVFENDTLRFCNSTGIVPRFIPITTELMWLYGLFVAEGSRSNLTLNAKETEIAEKAASIWVNTFKEQSSKTWGAVNYKIINHEDTNSLNVEFKPRVLGKDVFFNIFSVGSGARNKNLSFLYHIENKELIRSALIGLIEGDGCFRKRTKNGKTFSYSFSLKTTSKFLAYDFCFLLKKWFDIDATVYYGVSPERKIEGRILASSDYYKIDVYSNRACKALFGDYYGDIPQNNYIPSPPQINKIISAPKEPLYDITLDGGTHIFPINGGWLTHNCGGGNVLEYPDLIPLLERLKSLHLIPNITVHETHFMENLPLLHKLVDEKLIYGLGISMNDVEKEGFIEAVKEFPNAVLHVINGIVGIEQLEKLANNNLKILILGYKDVRRGKVFRSIPMMRVENEKKQKELYDALPEIIAKKWFDVVSFDNLAIKQLNPKGRFVSDEDWEAIYMGDDGLDGEQTSASMYIDLIENEFARNSCDVDHRMPVGNMSVKEMYKILCKMRG